MSGAAFFDLDRTLISGSSSLALTGAFRKSGILGVRQAVTALVHLVPRRDRRASPTAEAALSILRGVSVDTVHQIVNDAWDDVLRPLVYRDAIDLAESHAARGERVYVVSAALQVVVEKITDELGLDGAVASQAEVENGIYTGRWKRRIYGPAKAEALVEFAGSVNVALLASTAYSDSHVDLPFLDAVGSPVAVNPDRSLRRAAKERGWPIVRFRTRAFSATPR